MVFKFLSNIARRLDNTLSTIARWLNNEFTADEVMIQVANDFWDQSHSQKYRLRHDKFFCYITDMIIAKEELKKLEALCSEKNITMSIQRSKPWGEQKIAGDFCFTQRIW